MRRSTFHTTIRQLSGGTWGVCSKSGRVIAEYTTEDAALMAINPEIWTTEDRTARLPVIDQKAAWDAYDSALVDRLNSGLPLSRCDAKRARRLLRNSTL
jgi:hypothetical protein